MTNSTTDSGHGGERWSPGRVGTPPCSGLSSSAQVRRRGFTFPELIVAVGAVLLLTLGVAQIFRSIGSLVSTGNALAEVDQLARAIEAQMRDDFAALSRLQADDVFFAIRSRRIGDIDGDGMLDNSVVSGIPVEQAIYLSREDREADLRAGIAPYAPGSRAVTRRLDEMVFLAFAGSGGEYDSYQLTCDFDNACTATVSSDTARIYYGHGLRPAPDLSWEPPVGVFPTEPLAPQRQFVADGDFGDGPGTLNRFDPSGNVNSGVVVGRNEYAGAWPLLRQPLLLFGGRAAGDPPGSRQRSVICNDRSYSPYIRDLETMLRFGILDDNSGAEPNSPGGSGWLVELGPDALKRWNPMDGARPRLIRHGRVDICAQSPEDVKRWLEGEPSALPILSLQASAFDGGRFDDSNVAWQQSNNADHSLWGYNVSLSLQPARGIASAISGIFSRILCETAAPQANRADPNNVADRGCDAPMDAHAVIAANCSNFEIAWSDGNTWLRALTEEFTSAGHTIRLNRGDLIWHDWLFPRRALANIPSLGPIYGSANPDPEILSNIGTPYGSDLQTTVSPNERNSRLVLPPSPYETSSLPANNGIPWYHPGFSGGVPSEYLAVWGYREPQPAGGAPPMASYGAPWDKPELIRVRITLHDSELRLKEGKTYEFIFRLDLK